MNYPINRTDLRIFRGVSTVLTFVIRDTDRKAVNLGVGNSARWTMLNRDTQEVLISRAMTVVDAGKGQYQITVSPEDVDRLTPGTYRYTVVREGPNGLLTPLYTDRDYTLDGMVELRSGPFSEPISSHVIERPQLMPDMNRYVSSAFAGAAQTDNPSGHHQIAVYAQSMPYGVLIVQGSLDAQPSSQLSEWFDVAEFSLDDLTTPITAFSFEGKLVWVRFVIVPEMLEDMDLFEKILYRI